MRQGKEKQEIKILEKLFPCVDELIICIENTKKSAKQLLDLMHEFSNIIGYSIN